MKQLFLLLLLIMTQLGYTQDDLRFFETPTRNILPDHSKANEKISLHTGKTNKATLDSTVLKQDFKTTLEKRLNNVALDNLSKKGLLEHVDQLQERYRKNKGYQQIVDEYPFFEDDLNGFGKKEVAEDWLGDRVSSVKIFRQDPPKHYTDKQTLKQDLRDLRKLSEEKASIVKDMEADPSVLNNYHKYLKGQMDVGQFENTLKGSKSWKSDKAKRKSYKKLLKKIKKMESREQKIKEDIEANSYVRQLKKEQGKGEKNLKTLADTNEWEGEHVYDELHEQMENEDIRALLKNDYLSGKVNEQLPDFGKMGGDVIEKEALEVLDSLAGTQKHDGLSIKEHVRQKGKKEVEELLINDSYKKQMIPDNVYFEGIAAFSREDFPTFSLSPNVGYEFGNGLSMGLGMTLHHTRDTSEQVQTVLDYKTFAKYEVLNGLFFLQAEYVAMLPGISYLQAKESTAELKRTGVLLGGGVTIKVKGKNLVGLGIMYNPNRNMGVPTYDSPLLIRLGIKPF